MHILEDSRTKVQNRLTWFIFLDKAFCVLNLNRRIKEYPSFLLPSAKDGAREIQILLNDFYRDTDLGNVKLDLVDLCFLNSIFHKTSAGTLECYMNYRPGWLLYHREFWASPVTYGHIADRLQNMMRSGSIKDSIANLWFHLRETILYVTVAADLDNINVSAFTVQKILDVHYYLLFHVQTLQNAMPDQIREITISGELMQIDGLYNFLKDHFPDISLNGLPVLSPSPVNWDPDLLQYLPELIF